MSGGAFDYKSAMIKEFCWDVREFIELNETKDGQKLKPRDLQNVEKCHKFLSSAADVAHALEWLYSGDTCPRDLAKTMADCGMEPLESEED